LQKCEEKKQKLKKGGPPLFPSRLEVMTSEISFQGVGRIELREGEIKDFVVSSRLMRFLVISSSSGYNEQDTISQFQGKGLAGFIPKPYQPMKLIEKVREVLAHTDHVRSSQGNV